jgi:hypothetical protein
MPGEADPNNLLSDVTYRGVLHDQVVQQHAAYLRALGQTVQTEVSLRMADGSIGTRIDILARDPRTGIIYGLEIKTGDNPFYTPGQFVVYPHLIMGESVVATDPKALLLGITPGEPLPPIAIFVMRQKDKDSDPVFRPVNPRDMSRQSLRF